MTASRTEARLRLERTLRRMGLPEERVGATVDSARRVNRALAERDSSTLRTTVDALHAEFPTSRLLTRAVRVGRPAPTVTGIARSLDRRDPVRRAVMRSRIATLLAALDAGATDAVETAELLEALDAALGRGDRQRMWLALAVLRANLPDVDLVVRCARRAELSGNIAALADALTVTGPAERGWPEVKVVTGAVLVDVHHTAQTDLATGIQRVVRQSAVRWNRDHAPRFVGWRRNLTALRPLTDAEVRRALHGGPPVPAAAAGEADQVVVPWRCHYVLPELVTEAPRTQRIRALAEFSCSTTASIGFDCVPITTAETVAPGMGAAFAATLAAVARFDRVATISASAGQEYRGWRAMLRGAGLAGPQIEPIGLPVEATAPSDAALARARAELLTGSLPLVLCVGSHEPRKNHLAVLHAAELLWRDGIRFSLLFVGGNAWRSEDFVTALDDLQASGRPVGTVRGLDDELLWAAYSLARCTVFPSLNEGYGLPVAESLATGTPAITSDFGSMREIAADGGALLVDPRSDESLRDALRALLTDDAAYAELSEQARNRRQRTWDQYAAETWAYLVHGEQPPAPHRPDST